MVWVIRWRFLRRIKLSFMLWFRCHRIWIWVAYHWAIELLGFSWHQLQDILQVCQIIRVHHSLRKEWERFLQDLWHHTLWRLHGLRFLQFSRWGKGRVLLLFAGIFFQWLRCQRVWFLQMLVVRWVIGWSTS